MTDEIESKIKQELARTYGVDPTTITRETSFEEILGGDSLTYVELVMNVETLFDIKIRDADAAKAKTLGQLVDLVKSIPHP